MAKYTTTIKTLLDINYSFGLSDYPLFDPTYRTVLNKKITDHFQFREIGFETPALFVWFLNVKMREIMPYYNQLYASALLSYNPLHNVNMTETSRKETSGTAESVGTQSSETENGTNTKNKNIHSDTPQGMLDLDALEDTVHTYASDADIATGTATGTGSSNSTADSTNTLNNVDDYLRTVQGNNGNKTTAQLITEHRGTFLNVDMQVVKELEELFMRVW